MVDRILEYRIIHQIYDGSKTVVYRAVRESDQLPVVLKLLKNAYPSISELAQFKNQFTITKSLKNPGIVQSYTLKNYQNRLILVLEDFNGISLKEFAAAFPGLCVPIENFLSIALSITSVLQHLYCQRIIHKDIKPSNILINPATNQVKLIDFSIASALPREMQSLTSVNQLEGTLAYLSPEQTGRMNRGIDYRTDFYSLGITFYELLTGQLPFQSDDLMELVHCQLAKQPVPIHQLQSSIPLTLSAIVQKLMAKNAEDRYQSAIGLKHDLEQCLQQWQTTGRIETFEIAQQDICDRLVISEKLYGREQEIEQLLSAYQRIAEGTSEVMMIAGFSGIGKTAIVHEIHKVLYTPRNAVGTVRQRGYFSQGKFDQFQRNIPFSAFVQAFRDLIGQILTESSAQLERWRLKILYALDENAQVLIEVVPELKLILGEQPAVVELTGIAAQNRFNLVLRQFIQVFTESEHPLVIFLDDLQWADLASLELLKQVMGESQQDYLLLIGAYRSNEVSEAHALHLALNQIRQAGTSIHTISLTPLAPSHLNALIANTLSATDDQALPLTELVYCKTQGNPFFSRQFLKFLYEENTLTFDFGQSCWNYDLAQIKALSIEGNMITAQLKKLPQQTQALLKLAACIGNQFDLTILSIVSEQPPEEVSQHLWAALQEEFILLSHESYQFFHDQIQQAAYTLIPDDQKTATHLRIGQLLLERCAQAEQEEKLFEITNHLNLGSSLIEQDCDRQKLIELNLIAGQKAKASTAYAVAQDYFNLALNLLPSDSWITQYELTLKLHKEAVEVTAVFR